METMNKAETSRKLRPNLTDEQKAEALRIGSLEYKSHRFPDMRVEVFVPDKNHR
jgi:hypothetical protein